MLIAVVFHSTDPRQKRIHRRLLLVGRGPASFYKDACRLMAAEVELESTSHLVAHLVREIESALRYVLEPAASRSEQLAEPSAGAEGGHKARIRTVLQSLSIPESDPVAKTWLALALHARAHRSALAPARPLDEEFKRFWDQTQTIFDVVLVRFEERYLEYHRLLDELLAKSNPTRSDAKTLANRVPNNLVAFGYFFEKLDNPDWLAPLWQEGFFRHPPEVERDEEKGTTRFPLWPESSFLAKMAPVAPAQVLEIALQIPETENASVHEDLAEAAARMPGEMAAKLALKEGAWVDRQERLYRFLPEKLGVLICHLAKCHATSSAIELARSLLAVLPDTRGHKGEQSGEEGGYRLSPEPRARLEAWDYGEVLRSVVPDLVDAGGLDALSMFCDVLEDAIRLSQRSPNEAGEDHSSVWRPAIENHEQNLDRGIRELLVSAVRDAAERVARNGSAFVGPVVVALEARRWRVFQRIGLHTLRLFTAVAPDLVQERLVNHALFDEPGVRHEYYYLAKAGFPQLGETDKQKILDWIERGPDVEEFKGWYQNTRNDQPTEDIVSEYLRRWQRDKLAAISESLPDTWKRKYDEFVGELGPPEHPEFSVYTSGGWIGPTSPKTAEELGSLSVDEVLQFLRSWEAPGGWMGPSKEGLAMQLGEAVKSNPSRFAAEVAKFKELPRTYVEWLLWGLEEAASGKATFPWHPVLELCQWVSTQRRPDATSGGDRASCAEEWKEAQTRNVRLLSAGLRDSPSEIPIEQRPLVWEVLRPMTEDDDPTPEDELRDLGLGTGALSLAISRVRPLAVSACLHYGLWVQRNFPSKETVPEVQEVLDTHLDPRHDPSIAVRALYGSSVLKLFLLDQNWLERNLKRIFPAERGQEELREAAWESYMLMCRASSDVFEVMQREYEFAVGQIETEPTEKGGYPNPSQRLAEHLMIFYWTGKLALEGKGLIGEFFAGSPDELRAHALDFIGRSLHNATAAPPKEVLERLKELWEWRLEAAQGSGFPERFKSEMTTFGWWFSSRKFDDVWACVQLMKALRLVSKSEPEHIVVERLKEIAPSMPVCAVEALSMIVEGDKEGWGILGWRKQARSILASALQSGDKLACDAAVALVHKLGARGNLDFHELLSSGR